jgi:RNA polymerase sigma-70 factor, ECF subfamily
MATAFTVARRELPVNLTQLSDEDLAAASRSASSAGELLYRRHGAALGRFCLSILHDPHEAADAAHDAWLRALTALEGGASPSNFKAWLFAIARNRCTDSFRVLRTESLDGVAEDLVHLGTPVDERHEQQVQLDALWADVHSLSEAQRSAFVLSDLLGVTNAELSSSMRRPAESCRSLVADARTALRERHRGRESDCDDIRTQLRASRGPSRIIDAHLEVCTRCRVEARRERARRLIRSLAIVPIPAPGFTRLRAAQAWLSGLLGPGGSLPECIGTAVAAGAVAAAIGLGASSGGATGSSPEAPAAPAHVRVAQSAAAPPAPASTLRTQRTSRRVAAPAPARHQQPALPAPSVTRSARAANGSRRPSRVTTAPAIRNPALVQHAANAVTHLVGSTLRQPVRVTTAVPGAVLDSVDEVAGGATGAVSGLSVLPNS